MKGMILLKAIDLSNFEVIDMTPENKNLLSLTMWPNGELRFNGKLTDLLKGKCILLRCSKDAKQVLLAEVEQGLPKARIIPNSGSVKTSIIKSSLFHENAVVLPARYLVEWNETVGMWQGDFDDTYEYTPPINDKKVKKPKKKGLEEMLP